MPSKINSSGHQFDAQLQIRHTELGVQTMDFEGLELNYDAKSANHIVKWNNPRTGQFHAGLGQSVMEAVADLVSHVASYGVE